MPPTKRKTAGPAADERRPAQVYLYEQLVAVNHERGDLGLPGPDTAAVLAAQQAGRVITGAPYVDRTEPLEGVPGTVCVVWAVPVEAA